MRCRDVSRAIAAPNGAITEPEIRAHLAACPGCADRLEQARRLDRLWEATRPEAPSVGSWDRAWARIEQELASSPAPTVVEDPARSARSIPFRTPIRAAVGLALVAAAAGLLLVLMPPSTDGPGLARLRSDAPVFGSLDVPVGHTVLYHVDSAERRVIEVGEPNPAADEGSALFTQRDAGHDDYFALLGWFEAMPSQLASAPSASPFPLDVPVGQTVLYSVDTAEYRVIQVSKPNVMDEDEPISFIQSETVFDLDDYFALFGWFEAMPSQLASAPSASPFSTNGSGSPFEAIPH